VVNVAAADRLFCLALALALAEASPAEKLSPPTRAAMFMAIVGIALVGMFFIVAILLGGHWVRRQGSHRRSTAVPPDRTPIGLTRSAPQTENDSQDDDPNSSPNG